MLNIKADGMLLSLSVQFVSITYEEASRLSHYKWSKAVFLLIADYGKSSCIMLNLKLKVADVDVVLLESDEAKRIQEQASSARL